MFYWLRIALDLVHVFKAQFQRQAGVCFDSMNTNVNVNVCPVHTQHFVLLSAGRTKGGRKIKRIGRKLVVTIT